MKVNESNIASVPVKDAMGHEYGRLYFIPHDMALHIRGIEVQKSLVGFSECLSGLAIMPDGRGVDDHSSAVIADLTERFTAMVDTVCGVRTSIETFKEHRPLAVMPDDRWYAAAVIDALGDVDTLVLANVAKVNQQLRHEAKTPKWRKRR